MRALPVSVLASLLLVSCTSSEQERSAEEPTSAAASSTFLNDPVVVLSVDGRPSYYRLDGSGHVPPGHIMAVSENPEARAGAAASSPNDPEFSKQWGLAAVGAQSAWELSSGAGVVVAVIDTGVDIHHADLAGRVRPGLDLVDGGEPLDPNSHGTHVAGIIAAETNNGVGIAGMTIDTQVLPVRVLDERGAGDHVTIAEGIIWAVDNGASIVNLSLGGPDDSEVLRSAVQYAVASGAVVVAAAGNDRFGSNAPSFPAAYDNVIAVAATAPDDTAAMFSNTGTYVDIAAPGFAIYSTVPGGYAHASGTSQAAPFVSALAAMLYSTGLSAGEVRAKILTTARDTGPVGVDTETGHGVIDASAALGGARTSPSIGVLPPFPDMNRPPLPQLPSPVQPGLPSPTTPTFPDVPALPTVPRGRLALLSSPGQVAYESEFEVTISTTCSACAVSVSAPGTSVIPVPTGPGPARVNLTASRSGRVSVLIDGVVATSNDIKVVSRVEVTKTSRRGATATVSGAVSPSSTELRLQHLRNGSWRTVATVLPRRQFSFPMAIRPPGLYRVVSIDGGTSPTFTL